MFTKNLGKIYPELEGLPPSEQSIILEKARREIEDEGKSFFWGVKLVIVAVLIAAIIFSALYLIFGELLPRHVAPLIGIVFAFMVYNFAQNYNIKLVRPKVSELVKKNKI
jgi:CBS domain containing-hemolysin-like protein